jgi:hypothetical protein
MQLHRPFLIGIFATFGVSIFSQAAAAQVWLDATQLDGKLPDWVDAKYYHQPSEPPAVRRVWIDPVYRTVCKRIWHEPVYQTICERVWVEGHYETRTITTYDPCGCPITRTERVWVPGHYTTQERRVCVTPGYWEIAEVKELVTPGHWETSGAVNWQVR